MTRDMSDYWLRRAFEERTLADHASSPASAKIHAALAYEMEKRARDIAAAEAAPDAPPVSRTG